MTDQTEGLLKRLAASDNADDMIAAGITALDLVRRASRSNAPDGGDLLPAFAMAADAASRAVKVLWASASPRAIKAVVRLAVPASADPAELAVLASSTSQSLLPRRQLECVSAFLLAVGASWRS